MTLSSASTLAQVEAAYDENAGYDAGAGSVSMARDFVVACRLLLRRYNSAVGAGGASMSRDVNRVQAALDLATAWLRENDTAVTGGGTVVLDFRDGRL